MRLQRRITLHFSIQFVMLFVSVFIFFIFLLVLVANLLTKVELNANTVDGLVETIPSRMVIKDNEVEIDEKWSKLLNENDMWMQIIDKEGHVIYSKHTPSALKESYTINELLQIEETREVEHYPVHTYYDSWMNGEYYFLFGFQHNYRDTLGKWYTSYNDQGYVDEKALPALEKKLQPFNGYIQIFEKGELIQSIGTNEEEQLGHLDIIGRIYEPGKHPTRVEVYNDSETGISWILHLPGKESPKPTWIFSSQETQILLIAILISLFLTIMFSIWNGYRYGRPLLLFVNWLERMGKERYDEVLTEKEKKKVFKKKGKTRYRYRLYQEVFQSFYHMADKLNSAERERVRLEQLREEWMAGISHDLRTPLSTIQGYGHMLESNKYDFSAGELEEIGKTIRKKGDYMLELVNDFSLVFQLKNSGITLNKSSLELNHFVRKVVAKFKEDFTLSEYSFECIGMENSTYIPLDPKWFTRVLDNLIYNAIKHNPPDTRVTVRLLRTEESVNIQIEDNGIGMDEEAVRNLFGRYYRGTNTNEKSDGLGLGMSIAKAIVELHDGDLVVASEVGKGTTITIALPVAIDSAKQKESIAL